MSQQIYTNKLIEETSPYLLQHAHNPVQWYPWGREAFEKAKSEDKPIFLSIGYSTCHWCHVMAHESFEDEKVAELLNESFIAIKVDKEERPDIDSIYMSVCQAFTGRGGWPTSIFMTWEQKPFFAGTYFPKENGYGIMGFKSLLKAIHEKWKTNREELLHSAEEIVTVFQREGSSQGEADYNLIDNAIEQYQKSYDQSYGGFGVAPKFPAPHNLLFLLQQYEKKGLKKNLDMVENTLSQLYKGGIFDHIGYGFSRYSTDRQFLVPHFEKMLYDNALLILAYCKTFELTKNPFYRKVAEKTATYILREMTSPEGGFYSAQDADSDGEEGKYYVFEPSEIIEILGKEKGEAFNRYYDITQGGNFLRKNIPNLLRNRDNGDEFEKELPKLYEYRKKRNQLHLDDKILTSWNSLMIGAMCWLYRISRNKQYLDTAQKAQHFIEEKLFQDDVLFVSYRDGRNRQQGFLDDYANYISALLSLYDATFDEDYLNKADKLLRKAVDEFYDEKNGGFYLYGKDSEALILRPKESYDGAMPSGNSMMAYNLIRLNQLESDDRFDQIIKGHLNFMHGQAKEYPSGFAMYLIGLSDYFMPPQSITVVLKNKEDLRDLPFRASLGSVVKVIKDSTAEYKLLNDETTYYICSNHSCMPPVNELINTNM
ncbi:thioredoxin domain-containing protein [Anaerotignum sp.]|uniref:thioredoxin domain-containing protein n=1 Tax=Anaerotignum sp. TaxID=2039241 RepID=UPI00289D1A97|nr:thioredoxin domain-containing protein [Anaerotignum sp.]